MEIMKTIVDGLVDGLKGIGQGIGSALSSMSESIFVTTADGGAQTLTTFGGLVVVFAGISLGFSQAENQTFVGSLQYLGTADSRQMFGLLAHPLGAQLHHFVRLSQFLTENETQNGALRLIDLARFFA